MDKFKTIKINATADFIEKKSEFIGHAYPAQSEAEALAILEAVRINHAKATHNAFAYIIDPVIKYAKANDDGEPSGTAGMPILECLRKESLVNVIVVVTRYYGGIMLGGGGLTRAYGRAAREAVVAAGIAEMLLHQQFQITVPYHLSGKVQYEILGAGHIIEAADYAENVAFTVIIKNDDADGFRTKITDMTAAAAIFGEINFVYR